MPKGPEYDALNDEFKRTVVDGLERLEVNDKNLRAALDEGNRLERIRSDATSAAISEIKTGIVASIAALSTRVTVLEGSNSTARYVGSTLFGGAVAVVVGLFVKFAMK